MIGITRRKPKIPAVPVISIHRYSFDGNALKTALMLI
jgi:hypothetical protein